MNILPHAVNQFNGIEINTEDLPTDGPSFQQGLASSLVKWIQDGRFLVWLHLPIERSAFIPISTAAGFEFHHTEPNYVLLVRRLQEDALVPGYATHYIGAGGVVINDEQEILVVSERHRGSSRPYYKLPGGALHPGEHLATAVVREVLEETGIETEFERSAGDTGTVTATGSPTSTSFVACHPFPTPSNVTTGRLTSVCGCPSASTLSMNS